MAFIKIQRGAEEFSSLQSTITLGSNVASLTKAFVMNTNNRYQGGGPYDNTGNQEGDDMSGAVQLSAVGSVLAEKQLSTGNQRIPWEVWEYTGDASGADEFIVRGRYKLVFTTLETMTQSVSGISNIDDCIPFITGVMTSSATDDAPTAMAWMSSTGTLNVKRNGGTSDTVEVWVTVVEFTGSSWSVGHGLAQDNADSGNISLVTAAAGTGGSTFTVTDWDNAIIFHQFKGNNLDGTDDAISDTSAVYYPNTSTSVSFVFNANHVDSVTSGANSGNHLVHILKSNNIDVTRYDYSDSGPVTTNLTITTAALTNLEQSSVICSHSSSGTGTAYGRGWLNARLTSLTNAEMWVHRTGNTCATRVQIIKFTEPATIAVTDQGDEQLDDGDLNETITGYGFNATQSTGKVEIGNASAYASCTIKVTQSIDSWSDTSIQFDFSKGTLTDGYVYIYVTNSSAEVSAGYRVYLGVKTYKEEILALTNAPDLFHTFDNTYDDEQGVAAANSAATVGNEGFQAEPIVRGATHSWAPDDKASNIQVSDTTYTNVTTTHTERVYGGWIMLPEVFLEPTGFWEEGAQINNMYMAVGFGNKLMGNIADSNGSPAFKVQAFSEKTLTPLRPYHVAVKFKGGSYFKLFVDGVEQLTVQAGSMGTDLTMSTHSGNLSFGMPDTVLDTGGTDIQFPSGIDLFMSYWATWSAAFGGIISDEDIRKVLFELGAIEEDLITSDTESNIQSDIDLLADTAYVDKPLPLKIERKSGGGDLDLEFDNITFDDRCSIHVQFLGKTGETLTIVNTNGSNTTLAKCSTPYGGTIVIINPVELTLTGLEVGTEIRILKSGTATDADSLASSHYVSSTVGATHEFEYLYPLTGYTAIDISIIKPGYKQKRINGITLTASDVTLPVQQRFDRSYIL